MGQRTAPVSRAKRLTRKNTVALVLRTARVRQAEQYDCAQHLADLEVEFGADVLLRSVVWLTIKESRASFAIEHEEQHVDRVRATR